MSRGHRAMVAPGCEPWHLEPLGGSRLCALEADPGFSLFLGAVDHLGLTLTSQSFPCLCGLYQGLSSTTHSLRMSKWQAPCEALGRAGHKLHLCWHRTCRQLGGETEKDCHTILMALQRKSSQGTTCLLPVLKRHQDNKWEK